MASETIFQVLAAVAFLAASVLAFFVFRFSRRLEVFFSGGKAKDLESVMAELGKRLRDVEGDFKELRNDVARIDVMAEHSVQKVGVVRFNPFGEVGGDQSFAVALLDSEDNGVVFSSLYAREGSRVYAKPIVKGQSKHRLSDEEQEAIRQALKGR